MSKAATIREQQQEITTLKRQLTEANKLIGEYRHRDNPRVSDYTKQHH